MRASADIKIERPREAVWAAIIDIDNSVNMIAGIIAVEVMHRPESGLVGLKWKETRLMFGREASEVMWITESAPNEYYCTRAESHGSVYTTRLSLASVGGSTVLKMSFAGEARTLLAKILAACTGLFMKKSMEKALRKDLEDIKDFLEKG